MYIFLVIYNENLINIQDIIVDVCIAILVMIVLYLKYALINVVSHIKV